MTLRGVRIPRLTLFTGPNCSLCDVNIFSVEYKILTDSYLQVAKSTLARVRHTVGYTPLKTIILSSLHAETLRVGYG